MASSGFAEIKKFLGPRTKYSHEFCERVLNTQESISPKHLGTKSAYCISLLIARMSFRQVKTYVLRFNNNKDLFSAS